MISAATLCYTANGESHEIGPADTSPFHFDASQAGAQYDMRLGLTESVTLTHLAIHIRFESEIEAWRNHNYRWVDVNRRRLSQYYSPKLLRCDNGLTVAASHTQGAWEVHPKDRHTLIWHLIHPGLCPLPEFIRGKQRDFSYWEQVSLKPGDDLLSECFSLLWTHGSAEEWSRSPKGFGATVCLTDHCDFDSLALLKAQRELLNRHGIRVSKGFFTHHYSKRDDNASFEKADEREELLRWAGEGHELFCHGLSQSVKSVDDSISDFKQVVMPTPISCWVDHGFQYYNFTQRLKYGEHLSREAWLSRMREFGVSSFWNYLDSGESSARCLNQLDPYGFIPEKVSAATWASQLRAKLLNILYYYTDESRLYAYRQLAGSIKALARGKFSSFFSALKHGASLLPFMLYCLLDWKALGSRPSRYTLWAPLLFPLPHAHVRDMCAFQTVAIKHFPDTFSSDSLASLVDDCGACIGHTYFAFQENHHRGRVFSDSEGTLNEGIESCFHNLGKHISDGTIWNPTITELKDHYLQFHQVRYTHDEEGNLVVASPQGSSIPTREVS